MNASTKFPTDPTHLPIEGMTCASCVLRVERALQAVPGVERASVNLAAERAEVLAGPQVSRADLVRAIEAVGYAVPEATVELAVEGMTCASCVARVERALAAVPGVASAAVNLATERATVRGAADVSALIRAVEAAGYEARPVSRSADEATETGARKDQELRALTRDLILASALTLPVFVLEMGSHLIPALHMLIMGIIGIHASWLIQFALTTAVLAGPGLRFYRKGIPALLRAAPDMNSLVALGTLAAYAYSVVATFAPGL